MADIKSPEERSRNMAKIRSKDTKPEVWLRKQLFGRGYRYRNNVNTVPGHPDIWLAKYNTAVFVHVASGIDTMDVNTHTLQSPVSSFGQINSVRI